MFKDIKIITKCVLLCGIVLVVLIGQSLVSDNLMDSIDRDVEQQQNNMLPTLEASYQIKIYVIEIQESLTDIAATRAKNGLDDGFREAEASYQALLKVIGQVARLIPEKKVELENIKLALDEYYLAGKTMAHAYIEGGPEKGNQSMGSFDEASLKLQTQAEQLIHYIDTVKESSNQNINNSVKRASAFTSVSLIIAIILITMLLYFIYLWIIKPINELNVLFNKLNSGDANLNFRFQHIARNELGHIQSEFNHFISKLQNLAESIAEGSAVIQKDVVDLDESATNVNIQTKELFSRVDLLASAMTELAATSEEVASAMESTSTNVKELDNFLGQGHHATESTETSTLNVAKRINESANVIKELESHTGEIVAMVDNIRAIADQTNLLALNAAIEAARAGDQGRGFAVVADEVRALASRTQVSTGEINNIIQSLQRTANEAVEIMNQCHIEVKSCVDYAKESRSTIESSLKVAKNVSQQVFTVSTAMEQQTTVVSENTQNILEINESTNIVEKVIFQTVSSVASLGKQAEHLLTLANTFNKGR